METALPGALLAAALGLSAGSALKPTEDESGLPRPPQLMLLSQAEIATLESSPENVWPSVPLKTEGA